jgi:hypothetical protein
MREIKFRIWDINARKWLKSFNTNLLDIHEFNLAKIMQYTGLKDKNNKEIYEGDIFHIGSKKILYVVEWIDCGLKGRQIKNKSWIGLDYWKDDIEVIGNIYENSELLGENK